MKPWWGWLVLAALVCLFGWGVGALADVFSRCFEKWQKAYWGF